MDSCWPGILAVIVLVALLAILLLAMGRVPWCPCGYVKLWHSAVQSWENSQHLTDWYTSAHILDGFGFYLVLWLVGSGMAAVAAPGGRNDTRCGLGNLENVDFVIDHYRTATVALGYRGDSVVNSVGDVAACILGFGLPALLPVLTSTILAIAIGMVAAWVASANSTLVPMLQAPFNAINK